MDITTGAYITDMDRELSFQIGPGGFSFTVTEYGYKFRSPFYPHFDLRYVYGHEPRLGGRFSAVSAGWGTDMVLLVPVEVFDPEMSASYIEAANMSKTGTTTLNHTHNGSIVTAVWQADSFMLGALNEIYPFASYFHYLTTNIDAPYRDTIELIVQQDAVHIKVYNAKGLLAAESTKYSSLEDILYYVKKLSGGDSFSQYKLNLIAPDYPEAASFFAAYYRNIELFDL